MKERSLRLVDTEQSGLGRWFREQEHVLLFQRTWARFPASTWQLIAVCSITSVPGDPKHFLLASAGTLSVHGAQTYIQEKTQIYIKGNI